MNFLKRTAGIILTLIIALSAIAVPTTVFAATEETKDISLRCYDKYIYSTDYEAGYDYKVEELNNNNDRIYAEDPSVDYKGRLSVSINAYKKTSGDPPVVRITKTDQYTGEAVSVTNLRIKVTKFGKVDSVRLKSQRAVQSALPQRRTAPLFRKRIIPLR